MIVKKFIPLERFNQVLRILEGDDPIAAWVLSDDETPVHFPQGTQTLGQALFAKCGATWYGEIRFDDVLAVDKFETYVGWEA